MKTICSILICLIFFGCAVNRQKIMNNIDMRIDPISISDTHSYRRDLSDCTDYAVRVAEAYQEKIAEQILLGALLGAATGYATGKAFGLSNNSAAQVAGAGSIYGAGAGAVYTPNNVEATTINCLRNRGYLLLY